MSETQPLDPLEFGDEQMDDVDTTYPVLKPGIYDFEVQSPINKVLAKKQDIEGTTKYNGVIKYKTTDSATSILDKEVEAGWALTEWYPLQSFDKDTGQPTKKWKENWAKLIDAALGTTQSSRPPLAEALPALPGSIVRVRIAVEKDDEGKPRNRIAGFVKRDNDIDVID